MASSSLSEIAREMRLYANEHPRQVNDTSPIRPYQYQLGGGLILTLTKIKVQWQLSLTRLYVPPSKTEEKTCLRIFQVPGHAKRAEHKSGDWQIVRYKWIDTIQNSLLK